MEEEERRREAHNAYAFPIHTKHYDEERTNDQMIVSGRRGLTYRPLRISISTIDRRTD